MGRIKVNLTLDAEVAEAARALGLNMSRLAEAAIAEATKAERNQLWREETRASNAAYAEEIAREGLPLFVASEAQATWRSSTSSA